MLINTNEHFQNGIQIILGVKHQVSNLILIIDKLVRHSYSKRDNFEDAIRGK